MWRNWGPEWAAASSWSHSWQTARFQHLCPLPASSSWSHGGTQMLKLAGLGEAELRAWPGPALEGRTGNEAPGPELSTFLRHWREALHLAPCPHSSLPPPPRPPPHTSLRHLTVLHREGSAAAAPDAGDKISSHLPLTVEQPAGRHPGRLCSFGLSTAHQLAAPPPPVLITRSHGGGQWLASTALSPDASALHLGLVPVS